MYTQKQIENGDGLFSDRHTMIVQLGTENIFQTDSGNSIPNVGKKWHIAGGGRILKDGTPVINWCDLR